MIYPCAQRSGGLSCPNQAAYRFVWPGYPEEKICEAHSLKAKALAAAVGVEMIEEVAGSGDARVILPGTAAWLLKLEDDAIKPEKMRDEIKIVQMLSTKRY